MGRKGVSKRKPVQTKAQPFSSDKTCSSISSMAQELPRSVNTGKALPAGDRKKATRQG